MSPDEASIEAFWTLGRRNWRSPFVRVRQARYNVAPQQGIPLNYVPVIRTDADGALELTGMQWWPAALYIAAARSLSAKNPWRSIRAAAYRKSLLTQSTQT